MVYQCSELIQTFLAYVSGACNFSPSVIVCRCNCTNNWTLKEYYNLYGLSVQWVNPDIFAKIDGTTDFLALLHEL